MRMPPTPETSDPTVKSETGFPLSASTTTPRMRPFPVPTNSTSAGATTPALRGPGPFSPNVVISYVSPAVSPSSRKVPSGPVRSGGPCPRSPAIGPPDAPCGLATIIQPAMPLPALSFTVPVIAEPGRSTTTTGSAGPPSATFSGSTRSRVIPFLLATSV